MKKKMRVVFGITILILGMSCNVVFSKVERCRTIPDCLQNFVEENEKLARENSDLKTNIRELLDKLNHFQLMEKELQNMKENFQNVNSQLQWVNVPLDDTQPFDEDCEYRAKMVSSGSNMIHVQNQQGMFYASSVENSQLYFSLGYSGINHEFAVHTFIQYREKNKHSGAGNINGLIIKLEKRCATTP